MSDQTITLLILVLAVAVFVWNRIPVGIVALGVALALWATDVLTLDQAVEGFGNPTVVLIAALFVVAEALGGGRNHDLGRTAAHASRW